MHKTTFFMFFVTKLSSSPTQNRTVTLECYQVFQFVDIPIELD